MHVTFAPKGILQIEDARIIWPNFEGRGGPYNREGNRTFNLLIPDQEIADALIAEGWNVKIKAPINPDDNPFIHMEVKVKFNEYGPNCYLQAGSGGRSTKLTADTVDILDHIEIESVDLDIAPRPYEMNGRSGVSAYLRNIWVTQKIDRFAERYAQYAPDDEVQY